MTYLPASIPDDDYDNGPFIAPELPVVAADTAILAPTCTKSPAQVRTLFALLLRADEVAALAAVLFERQTQREYAQQLNVSREWVKRRIGRAIRKLAAADVHLRMPGKGRRATGHQPLRFVDPVALNQLRSDGQRIEGRVCGTWKTAKARKKRLPD